MKRLASFLLLLAFSVSDVNADQWITNVKHPGDAPLWADNAGAFWSGNDLYGWCTGTSNSGNKSNCYAYVAAIADVAQSLNAVNACIPNGVTVQQIADVTTQYLRNHPAIRQRGAMSLTMFALMDAFPCRAAGT
jgi:hypothetical protein